MNHEIAIIGAGPAGSTAAILLVQFGFDVCLIEKKTFPRDVLCGEFLSKEIIANLKELNLFNDFLNLKPNPINSFKIIDDSGVEVSTSLNFTAYGLKRSSFDNFLLMSAKDRGVKVYQPCEVIQISKDYNGYNIELKTRISQAQKINAQYIIAGYGKRNYLDAKLNRKFVGCKSQLNGVKYHISKRMLKNFDNDQIQIYTSNGIYCGVNCVNDDQVTFCFLEDRRNSLRTPMQSINYLAERNEKFKLLFSAQLNDAFLTNRVYGAGDIYFGTRNKVENGIFMIGDAAQVIAPLAGDGISIAMDSAKLLANLFYEKKKKNLSDDELYVLYDSQWKEKFNKRLRIALFIQKVLFNRVGRKIGVEILKQVPKALSYFVKSTRG